MFGRKKTLHEKFITPAKLKIAPEDLDEIFRFMWVEGGAFTIGNPRPTGEEIRAGYFDALDRVAAGEACGY